MSQNTTENDLHEGFAKDLIEQIAITCKFRYEIQPTSTDNGEADAKTKQWSGIVGEIVKKVNNHRSFFRFQKYHQNLICLAILAS